MSDEEREREPSVEEREHEREKSEEPAAAAAEDYKIFVGGISWHLDDRDLKDTFRKYGAVDARVMLDRVTNRSRGFGFVHFDNKEDMEDAIEKLHNTEIDGRKISVTRAIPQDSIQPGTPAHALSKGRDRRRDDRYDSRYSGRGYDRYASRGGGYDRYADYDRYDRGYGGSGSGYGDGYDRYGYGGGSEYRDDYYSSSYGRSRDPYDSRRSSDYDRYGRSGGPERSYDRYSSRAGPYDRR